MESQPQNPEFRINPENFHPCVLSGLIWVQTVRKGYQQMTLEGKELKGHIFEQ